jgi:hypothetical protein
MKRGFFGLMIVVIAMAAAAPAYAQGGGASSTGTIQGRITDAQGAVLPGVTVTASSPSALGVQTTVSSETGNYRFPAIPPGTYTVTYELTGFSTVKREGIQIALGFTANVNIELALATLQETVTVTGESPIIDTTATRVVQNFKLEQLQALPNGRDMWSLLAVTPGVQMARIDVGGNRAGTQTDYRAYGQLGQVRVLIEGINTTEGTGGAGFYFDYSSLEEVFLGTTGQTAEMPNPGVQSQFIAKSGGNQFNGEYYIDWYNNSLQGSNIPDEYTAPTAFNNSPIRAHSNEIDRYYDTAINVGGPIKRDKVWWFGTYRKQLNAIGQPNFLFDQTFDTTLWNAVGKGTYQATQNHKFIGYYQWGQKIQPNRIPFANYKYLDPSATNRQDSGSWVYKAEWNGTLSEKLYVEARYGDFGYYFPQITNGTDDYFFRDIGRLDIFGSHQKNQNDRDRKQWTGAATYFLDTAKGSHTLKAGAELLKELQWIGFLQGVGGNIEHVYNNGVANQLIFRIPTATQVGGLKDNDEGHLTSRNALDAFGAFVNDTWAVGRLTINGGVRWDHYKGWLPEQIQLGQTVGPVVVAAKTFDQRDLYTWNVFAPRIGVVYDLSGNGRTVVKGNYGLYWHNPGVNVSSNANPNTSGKSATYNWVDANNDQRWQPGEETTRTAASLEGSIQLDPNIKAPYTHEAAAWFEQQISEVFGVRAGFVYKTEDDLINTYIPGRGLDVYAANGVPFTFIDNGLDGLRGTADDRNVQMVGLPSANAATQFPDTQFVMNLPQYARYKTIETSLTKRYSNRWSATIGFGHTWTTEFLNDYPQSPNQPGAEDITGWGFKASGSYDAPFGFRLSPVLRHQSGVNYARRLTIQAPTGLFVTGVTSNNVGLRTYADSSDSNREDNIWVLDVRTEKTVNIIGRTRARLFLDLFNITNSHASETINRDTGTSYQKPSAILAPFTTRVGLRFLW